VTKKPNKEFGNTMWVLQDANVAKCNLTIMDVGLAQLAKKTNENFGKTMRILWGDNVTKWMKLLHSCPK